MARNTKQARLAKAGKVASALRGVGFDWKRRYTERRADGTYRVKLYGTIFYGEGVDRRQRVTLMPVDWISYCDKPGVFKRTVEKAKRVAASCGVDTLVFDGTSSFVYTV